MRIPTNSAVGFVASLLVVVTTALATQLQVGISLDPSGVRISYLTEQGVVYRLERSTNFLSWDTAGPLRQGTGLMLTEDPILPVEPLGFFRVVSQAASTNLSPSPAAMAGILVNTSWRGYTFDDTNRFHWSNEPGNWTYTKTGPDTGLIVFTYDEDANNPAIYREEVVLTFVTQASGTARYSEWIGNVERPTSIRTFSFNFDLAPTSEQIAARLVGQTWEGYYFTSATRFELPGSPPYPGNWSYTKTGLKTGLMVFTYDDSANNPAVYREELQLTFTSASPLIGTYRYSAFVDGVEDPSSVFENQPFEIP